MSCHFGDTGTDLFNLLSMRMCWTENKLIFSIKDELLVKMTSRPVAHDGRVGSGLAGEGDSFTLQDGARLDGQGHHRRVYTWKNTRSMHN